MKKLLGFLVIMGVVLLGACSSPEADEIIEYQNSYVEFINPLSVEIDEVLQKINMAATAGEAYEIQENELVPIAEDIKDFIDSKNPESDVVKEYHAIIEGQLNNWYDGIMMEYETMGQFINGEITEAEAQELYAQASEKYMAANEYEQEALDKMDELAQEYNIEEEELEE
ncbi:hypothetical protein [Tenuibacillus multivorans]|uniref:Lipoprotein n=1 Tax=Tenuibacillus multivorans TaxID=237069 RepID=A0A1G9WI32_9BACI|nr:hypothetical protein [Tenuibacillus multivorans]GEL76475.1 hypothetical protein TMU01_07100 [Tenuibacillus multivorans]SDM84198.1 hypothetical protein SAMN05216498_0762 [Tenuibacillus multivorans]